MDYDKLVKAAGYKGGVGDYIARKLKSRGVPDGKLNRLYDYFPGSTHLAGVEISELESFLPAAWETINKPAVAKAEEPKLTGKKQPKKTEQGGDDTAVEDGNDGNN